MNINELKTKLQAELLAARELAEACEKESRDFTGEERAKVAAHVEEAGKLKAQLKQLEADEEMKRAILDLGAGVDMSQPQGKGKLVVPGKGATVGEQFVNSPEFKDWMNRFPGGRIPGNARGIMSPPVAFKTLLTGATDTSAGAFVQTDYTGIYEALGRYPLGMLDLISRRTTGSDLVEFVRQTAQVTQAAVTAEATATDTGGSKPEAAMTFEQVQAGVLTIAAWIPATKRALSDAAQIRGIIDQELRDDLLEELENQLVNGAGGAEFTGILNTANVLAQAWDTDIFTTIRKAKTALQVTGRSRPTALLLNPEDWETVELTQDLAGRYYYGGPLSNGAKQVWSVPVVECQSLAAGQGIMGDFRKAVLWDREQASIQVSDSHDDFFIRNMVAILSEMRAAFGVIRPTAFIIIDLAEGS